MGVGPHHLPVHMAPSSGESLLDTLGCFLPCEMDWTWEDSVHFLVRLCYRGWWWRMLYPPIDFLQVLILEIRRALPSASSKQRLEVVKTPHNSFQRETAVMDHRLLRKWGLLPGEQTGTAPVLATRTTRKWAAAPPSLLPPSLLPSLLPVSLPPSLLPPSLPSFFSFLYLSSVNPPSKMYELPVLILHFSNEENKS